MGEDSFFCLGKKYYFTQKLSFLINILFKNVFQALGVITLYKLNNATVCETRMIKSISSLEKVFSSLIFRWKLDFRFSRRYIHVLAYLAYSN